MKEPLNTAGAVDLSALGREAEFKKVKDEIDAVLAKHNYGIVAKLNYADSGIIPVIQLFKAEKQNTDVVLPNTASEATKEVEKVDLPELEPENENKNTDNTPQEPTV